MGIPNEWLTLVIKMRRGAFVETRTKEAFHGLADGIARCIRARCYRVCKDLKFVVHIDFMLVNLKGG